MNRNLIDLLKAVALLLVIVVSMIFIFEWMQFELSFKNRDRISAREIGGLLQVMSYNPNRICFTDGKTQDGDYKIKCTEVKNDQIPD